MTQVLNGMKYITMAILSGLQSITIARKYLKIEGGKQMYTVDDIYSIHTIGFHNDEGKPLTARHIVMNDGHEICTLSYSENGVIHNELMSMDNFAVLSTAQKWECSYVTWFTGKRLAIFRNGRTLWLDDIVSRETIDQRFKSEKVDILTC